MGRILENDYQLENKTLPAEDIGFRSANACAKGACASKRGQEP